MLPNIALIVGNGLTSGLLQGSGNTSLNSSSPLSFQFNIPFDSDVPWQDAFPTLKSSLEGIQNSRSEMDDFDAFNTLLTNPHSLKLEATIREFLTFAYSSLQSKMDPLDKEDTPWTCWLRRHRSLLSAVVSFNYDLLLEVLLKHIRVKPVTPYVWDLNVQGANVQGPNLTYNVEVDLRRMGLIQTSNLLLLKPHGSIDFTPVGISIPRTYPDSNVVTLNDAPLMRVPRQTLGTSLQEAYIVAPKEHSPYREFQWVRNGEMEFARRAGSITHCVFLGLRYWEGDRPELNDILDSLPSSSVIVEANPSPNPDFRSYVESSGRCYIHWEGDPPPI